MIQRLQQISAQLFKNALKTYTRKDVLIHKYCHAKSLTQTLMLYPNQGVNFFIRRKNWTPGLFYHVTRSECKSNRNATFYGIKHWRIRGDKKDKEDYPTRLNGCSKRGVWTYELGNFTSCKTDNGIEYTREDFKAYMKVTGVGIPKKVADSKVSEEQAAGEEEKQDQ